MRNDFLALVNENEKVDPSLRIKREDMCVDPYLKSDIEIQTLNSIEKVNKESLWVFFN